MTPELRMPPGVPEPAGLLLTCRCGQRNVVPIERLLERPSCGRCKRVLLEPGREIDLGAWVLAILILAAGLAGVGALVGAGIAVCNLVAVVRGVAGGMAAGLGLAVVALGLLGAVGVLEQMARALRRRPR